MRKPTGDQFTANASGSQQQGIGSTTLSHDGVLEKVLNIKASLRKIKNF